MNGKYFVVAGNKSEYLKFVEQKCQEHWAMNNTQNLSYSNFVYATADNLRGYRNPSGWFIHSWYMRDDIHDIFTQLRVACDDPVKSQQIQKLYNKLIEIECNENLYK